MTAPATADGARPHQTASDLCGLPAVSARIPELRPLQLRLVLEQGLPTTATNEETVPEDMIPILVRTAKNTITQTKPRIMADRPPIFLPNRTRGMNRQREESTMLRQTNFTQRIRLLLGLSMQTSSGNHQMPVRDILRSRRMKTLDEAIRTALAFRRPKLSRTLLLREADGPDGQRWAVELVDMKVKRKTVGGMMQSTFNFPSERESMNSAFCFSWI